MEHLNNSYSEIEILVESENFPEELKHAIIGYLKENAIAYEGIENTVHSILDKASRDLRIKVFIKNFEYDNQRSIDLITQRSGIQKRPDDKFKLVRPDRWQHFCRVLSDMCSINLLDESHFFIKNATKSHNKLILGLCAVLYENKYMLDEDISGKKISESRAVKSLFHDFNAPVSTDDYFRKEEKEHNKNLAHKKLPVIDLIEIEISQNHFTFS